MKLRRKWIFETYAIRAVIDLTARTRYRLRKMFLVLRKHGKHDSECFRRQNVFRQTAWETILLRLIEKISFPRQGLPERVYIRIFKGTRLLSNISAAMVSRLLMQILQQRSR